MLKWHEYSGMFFNLGLVISLLIANVIINYVKPITIGEYELHESESDGVMYLDIKDFRVVSDAPLVKDKVIKKIPKIFTPLPEDVETQEAQESHEDFDIDNFNPTEQGTAEVQAAPNPPPIEEDNKVYSIVQNMPYLKSCESLDEGERRNCTQIALLKFIQKNLKYPAIAKENGIQGTVIVSFTIQKDGSLTDIQIIRDIGAGCGQEVVKVLKKELQWHPGYQNKRPVVVKYSIPIRFKLQ